MAQGSPDFIVISGLSGSGKSAAVREFEDLGAYCVDNLPTALFPKMLELSGESALDLKLVVLGMDIRDERFTREFPALLERFRSRGVSVRLLFLEASEETLIRRYGETRRSHPLKGTETLQDAIRQEMRDMASVRALADRVFDTTAMKTRDLRERILELYHGDRTPEELAVSILTFGYKYGLPHQADLVFDARFLPNPFFIEDLKHRTGLEKPVIDFVLRRPETTEFLERLTVFLDYLVPRYLADGRSYLTIGIGCTGGRHRSVAVSREVAAGLRRQGYRVTVRDRDIKGE